MSAPLPDDVRLRPIEPRDDARVAAIIRQVLPEFGGSGPGYAIMDPEVNAMSAAYATPRARYLVVEVRGPDGRLQDLFELRVRGGRLRQLHADVVVDVRFN